MVSVPVRGRVAAFAAPFALCVLMVACSRSTPSQTASRPPELWGDSKPIVSAKELMRDMIDPASDYIFDSVSTKVGPRGRIAKVPKTAEDWDRIRFGAVTLVEGVYLLKIPRPFTPPGDENDSAGPNPSELSQSQILAEAAGRPGPVERQNRGAAQRRTRSAPHRQAQENGGIVGRGRQPRDRV
jgi:hypothetical protein